jgi:glycosyltransferase involved in cell wall biosynthesis
VSPRKTGLVTKPTAAGLAEAMDELWRDRSLAAKLGRSGRETYERLGLSWGEVVKKLLA